MEEFGILFTKICSASADKPRGNWQGTDVALKIHEAYHGGLELASEEDEYRVPEHDTRHMSRRS